MRSLRHWRQHMASIQNGDGPTLLRWETLTKKKFDQLDRSLPYAALLQSLRGLCRQLLAEPDQQIQKWRQRIVGALGDGAAVLSLVLPELTQLLGPQSPAPADLIVILRTVLS